MIDFEKSEVLPLTKEVLELLQDANVCYIRGKGTKIKLSKIINYRNVRDYCHDTGKCKGTARSICSIEFNLPNWIPMVFQKG